MLALTLGCSEGVSSESDLGTAYMPLAVEGASGTQYKLNPARFRFRGGNGINQLIDASGEDSLSFDNLPGNYSVELLNDWKLNTEAVDGTLVPVAATLTSANPQFLTITEGNISDVSFRFGIGDDAIAFGQGRGRVLIEVDEPCTSSPEVCDGQDNDCDGEIDDGVCSKRIFTSRGVHDGNFGGLAGLDAFCQTAADAAGLDAQFWGLVYTSTVSGDPFPRVVANGGGPFVRMDGAVIAANTTELSTIGGGNSVVPKFNEYGADISQDCPSPEFGCPNTAWVGNDAVNCSDWQSTAGNGALASLGTGSALWFNGSYNDCAMLARVYCVEK